MDQTDFVSFVVVLFHGLNPCRILQERWRLDLPPIEA